MKLSNIALVISAASLFPWSAICEEPAAVVLIGREAIKEGKSAAHEKVENEWARAFRRAKFPYYWLGMSTMTGPSEVWFVSFYHSFAEIEQSDKKVESTALKNESELLDARDGELRAGSRSMVAVYRKDLSYHADQAVLGKARYAMLGIYQVKLGHVQEFEEGSKQFLAAFEKSNYPLPVLCYQVVGGGQEGVFHFFTPLESLAPLDSMREYDKAMAEAMGAEQMEKLTKGMGDVFTSVESSYFRISPKMSYLPAEVEAVAPEFWRPKPAPAPKPAAAPKPAQ